MQRIMNINIHLFKKFAATSSLPARFAFIAMAILSLHCAKKTFMPMPEPAVIIQLSPNSAIDIVQEPLKDGLVKWPDFRLKSIDIEGALRVNYKNIDYFYWQLKCPAELSCNGEKAYIPISMTEQYAPEKMPFAKERQALTDLKFYVTKKEDLPHALAFREFVRDFTKPQPEKYLSEMLKAYINDKALETVPAQVLLGQLFLYSLFAVKDHGSAIQSKGLVEYADKYGQYSLKNASLEPAAPAAKPAEASAFATALNQDIEKIYVPYLDKAVERFPWTEPGFKKLAEAYDQLRHIPGLREKIFLKLFAEKSLEIVNEGGYRSLLSALLDPAAAQPKQTFGFQYWEDGLVLTLEAADKKTYEFYARIESTASNENGLEFEIMLEPKSEASLQRLAESKARRPAATEGANSAGAATAAPSMDAGSVQTQTKASDTFKVKVVPNPDTPSKYLNVFKKFDADAKALAKTITDDAFKRGIDHDSIFYFAIKHGKGGYDKQHGFYNYTITLTPGKVYNTFLAMAKYTASGGSAGTADYSGIVDNSIVDEFVEKNSVRWVQSAKGGSYEFYLTGSTTFCQRSCHTEQVDEHCFGDGKEILVSFDPVDLKSQVPKATIDFQTPGDSRYCNKILGAAKS